LPDSPEKPKRTVRIRGAAARDIERINDIYNQAVITTTATFDTEPKSLDDQRGWFAHHDANHPVLVAEEEARVCGWASLSQYSDRAAYARTVEVSIYVAEEARGRGVGSSLMNAIADAARQLGHHTILARITADNPVSVRLHQHAGFEMVGTMREVGFKLGKLLDVHIMQLVI
jgi:phosphinothricin acetyltransferase